MAKQPKSVFVCGECGYESTKWLGKCPACDAWNTFFEQKLETKTIEAKKQNKENVFSILNGDNDYICFGTNSSKRCTIKRNQKIIHGIRRTR